MSKTPPKHARQTKHLNMWDTHLHMTETPPNHDGDTTLTWPRHYINIPPRWQLRLPFGWRLICAHIIPLKSAHRLFYIIFNSSAHTWFASSAHTSITFLFKQPMLPQTQMRTHDSPHLRTHKLSHDDLFLLIASFDWWCVNNVPLDIHLHDDLFLLIASTGSRHTDALRLIDDVGLGWAFHLLTC